MVRERPGKRVHSESFGKFRDFPLTDRGEPSNPALHPFQISGLDDAHIKFFHWCMISSLDSQGDHLAGFQRVDHPVNPEM